MNIATFARLSAALLTALALSAALPSDAEAQGKGGKGGSGGSHSDGHDSGDTHDDGGVTDGHTDHDDAAHDSGGKGKGPKYKGGDRTIGHAGKGARIEDVVFRGHRGGKSGSSGGHDDGDSHDGDVHDHD